MSSYNIIEDYNGLSDNERYNQYTGLNGVDTSYISSDAVKSVLAWFIPGGCKTSMMAYAGAEIPAIECLTPSSSDDSDSSDDSSEDVNDTTVDDSSEDTDDSSEDVEETPVEEVEETEEVTPTETVEETTSIEETSSEIVEDDTKSTGTVD